MKEVEISGKTVEKAIQRALEQLGVSREEVDVTILSEGRLGLLGLGAEEARIRVEPLKPMPEQETDIAAITREVLEKLLSLLEVEASIMPDTRHVADGEVGVTAPIAFNIRGDDLGILIGRRGQTLAGLQSIVRLIVGQQTKSWLPIVIDIEGYKERRQEALSALAQRIAEQVSAKGTPFTPEPMPAYERRIVHLALRDHPSVITESIGDGESRKVVIQPKK